jgi:hypothetical protein
MACAWHIIRTSARASKQKREKERKREKFEDKNREEEKVQCQSTLGFSLCPF